jgi:geranylgeranyl pyrophosphate synthase
MGQELRDLLEKYGSLNHARTMAREYTCKAQANLEEFPPVPEKAYFRAFTEELLDRTH